MRARLPWLILGADALVCLVALIWGGEHPTLGFEEGRIITKLNAVQLLGCASLALLLYRFRVRTASHAPAGASFWLLVALGSLYLALDELLEFHERSGKYLQAHLQLAETPLHTAANLILLGYGFAVVVLCLHYRAELTRDRRALVSLLLGAAFLGSSQVFDFFPLSRAGTGYVVSTIAEESSQFVGFGVILGALFQRLHFEWIARTAPLAMAGRVQVTRDPVERRVFDR